MIDFVDVFLYVIACGFGVAINVFILAVVVLFIISLVDKFVIKPEYERIENE